ncbi:PREDICTED: uncharacterized protein LOC109357221 isoform X2 [Lupinus angustifolius]|uniref:uncharacterized protein LOC109357221 isoform X1 n=1 Tax=Lupinus angustifolius TaxID=3871 RepID=UPI00092EDAA8|nr:PREDICTED: uncharacterized protein LOC109357221 isoform X1 [Lupinus angustifolius]XP_019456561.1 PREDICTED: uncharacterized protein LOC109357221 isoform X2 [Lupinus angustifolius]
MTTLQCNSLLFNRPCHLKRPLLNPNFLSSTRFISASSPLKNIQTFRWGKTVSAIVSEENAVGSSFSATDVFKLTYLEGNSWLWNVGGANILVDPILVGNLDFGIPWLYDAAKKVLKKFQLSDLPEIDCVLITQSLDDHCHLKTLKPFSEKFPSVRVIATPNAKSLLDPIFRNVTYLEPGQSSDIETNNGSKITVKATAGPVLGPPWQRPENGYIVRSPQGQLSLYYEPHCVYNQSFIEKEKADIVITPVIKQLLPSFTLVSGQEDAVRLAKLLQAKFVVPMRNGDLDGKGILASIIQSEGTIESFKELLSKELPDAKVVDPTPGIPVEISAN